MHRDREDHRAQSAPGPIRPGRLTDLLQALARAPEPEPGSAAPPLSPGVRVGRFELVRELGRGGFGVVWEARDAELDRSVALKLVRARRGAARSDEQLLREAEAAARLSHPNLVTLYDAGRCERGPYLVLELLRGETLAERLEAGPVAPREALRIATEIAKGLAHAHARGIFHRDLKPGNVFLCEDGQVKIVDLGLARAFGRPNVEGGTPGFMAPEQWRGAPEDERTDVFALGVILHRMLAGELPFADDGGASPRASRPAPPLELPAAPGLPSLVARMLAHDPVDRPRHAGEVLPQLASAGRELDGAPAAAHASAPRRRRRRRGWALAGAVIAGVLVAVGVHVQGTSPRAPASATAAATSIAVLPFADLSAERDQEHFSDGIAEEIRSTLTRVEGLRVIGRSSSVAFRSEDEDARGIGGRLGVEAVLEGSVRKAGARVRVAVQLVQVSTGAQVWSAMYDRDLTDVFAVQSEIARDIVGALDVRVRTGALAAVPERPSTTPAAYQAYLLGRHRAAESAPDRPASELFEEAARLDPAYAPAWAALSSALVQWTHYLSEPSAAHSARVQRALEAAERAIAIAPRLPDGYEARARVRSIFLGDWAGAVEDLDRALALDPGRSIAHRLYGGVLSLLGRREEALRHLQKAVELDPFDGVSLNNLAVLQITDGRLDLARRTMDRLIEIDSRGPVVNMTLGELTLLEGRPADALAIFERNRVEWNRLLGRVLAHHALGNDRESRDALAELTARYGETRAFAVATGHAWRGERDAAFEWLERAIAVRGPGTALEVRSAFLRDLFPDPRYAALLRRMNLPARDAR